MATERQRQILATAADLVADRGFHGVSVHDIGAACGISGPALYRHFDGKQAILAAMLVDISERLLAEGRARAAAAVDETGDGARPRALEALIGWHVEFALAHPALIVVQEREWANLTPDDRDRVRTLQLAYVDLWVDALRRRRTGLDRRTARAAVQATFGLINSTPHSARIGRGAMADLLTSMARDALVPHRTSGTD